MPTLADHVLLPSPTTAAASDQETLLLALHGDPDTALAHCDRRAGKATAAELPALLTLRARLLLALLREGEGRRALQAALRSGHPDAVALATLVQPDGEAHGRARLVTGSPGQQADAACDLAWRSLLEGRADGARAWLGLARERCPGHVETHRWLCFLDDAGPELAMHVAAGRGEVAGTLLLDATMLLPRPETLWRAPERWERRELSAGAQPDALPAPSGSALALLRDQGVITRFLALDHDYAELAPDHPLVACEWALGRAVETVDEARPAVALAHRAWALARAHEPVTADDCANALVTLGLRDPSCAALALQAQAHLAARQPDQVTWRAYGAGLLLAAGQAERALAEAQALARLPQLDQVSLALVADVMWTLGDRPGRAELLERATSRPALAETARRLREQAGQPALPACSPRLRPRLPA